MCPKIWETASKNIVICKTCMTLRTCIEKKFEKLSNYYTPWPNMELNRLSNPLYLFFIIRFKVVTGYCNRIQHNSFKTRVGNVQPTGRIRPTESFRVALPRPPRIPKGARWSYHLATLTADEGGKIWLPLGGLGGMRKSTYAWLQYHALSRPTYRTMQITVFL